MEAGKVSESVLKRSVLKYVQQNHNKLQQICPLINEIKAGSDGALFDCAKGLPDKMGSATAAAAGRHRMIVVEAMITACNNLFCCGAEAFGVTVSLVLPKALYESELRHMMEEASEYASQHQITILGGHTMVSPYVTETVVTVTALGRPLDWSHKPAAAGMDIVMSKWLGLKGTAQIAAKHTEALEKRLPPRFVAEAAGFGAFLSIEAEARIAMELGASSLHDVSGGGVFRALWELAEAAGTGLRVELKQIPVRQETIEVCEVFGLNPYELSGGGALLMVSEDGQELAQKLQAAGVYARVIGRLTDNHDRVLVSQGEDGEELRYLDRPRTDEIDKM